MSVYLSEDEQIDMIRKWWNQFGHWIMSAICLLMLILLGYQWLMRHEQNVAQSASLAYEQLLSAVAANDTAQVDISGKALVEKFPGTPYADLSNMMLARFAVTDHDNKRAANYLQHVIDNSKTNALRQIARLRLVKVLLDDNKPADALGILNVVDDKTFMPAINSAKGDCFVAMKKNSEARSAYQAAINDTPKDAVSRSLLEMKLTDLPGVLA